MSQSRKMNARFGNVTAQTANIDGFVAAPQIKLDAGAVTQLTSITTAVTLPSSAGIAGILTSRSMQKISRFRRSIRTFLDTSLSGT